MSLSSLQKKIIGPVLSIITPFKKNGNIDYNSLKSYLNFSYHRGARTFYLMFYNSRLGLLNSKEIITLNKFCIKEVKKLNKNCVIICATPYHISTEENIKIINDFYRNGADIVSLIFGEKYYSDQQVFDHFKKINANTKCKLLLHQQILENGLKSNPPFVLYNLKLLKKIFNLRNFIAMKEDAKNNNFTKKICKLLNKKTIIITSGNGKRQWLFAKKYGCQSWLSGISNLDPKISTDFYNFVKKHKISQYMNIIKKLEDPFFVSKKKFGWHMTIKGFLELNKKFNRYERSPLYPLNNNDMKKITTQYKVLLKNNTKYFNSKYKL